MRELVPKKKMNVYPEAVEPTSKLQEEEDPEASIKRQIAQFVD